MTKLKHRASSLRSNRLAFRAGVLYFSIPALAIALMLIIGIYATSAISDDFARRLARQYSIEAAASFLTSTNSHFVLAQQLAHSTTISRWLVNEQNEEFRARAIEEIMGYSFYAPYIFLMFTAYESRNVYDLRVGFTEEDFIPWWQVEDGASWFFDTRDAELPFNLNIQRSRPIDGMFEIYVWTNHRMYYQGRFAGVVTAGSPFQAVFDAVFGDYYDSDWRGYIIDNMGLVRVDSAQILEVLDDGLSSPVVMPEIEDNPDLQYAINLHLQTMRQGAFRIGGIIHDSIPLQGDFTYASIAPIIGTNWSAVVLSSNFDIFDAIAYLPAISGVIAVLIVSVFIGNLLIRRVALVPLYRLTQSTADIDVGELFGLERADEIGDLARTIKQSQETLEYRERMLSTNNTAAHILLASASDINKAISEAMEVVGRSIDVDRVRIWVNETINDELHYTLKHSWINRDRMSTMDMYKDLSFPYSDTPGWLQHFNTGGVINGPVREMPTDLIAFLGERGIKSIVIRPLFINNEFYGSLSVSDYERERIFSVEEMEMLTSTGLMFASAMIRHAQMDAMAEAQIAEESNNAKSRFLARMSHEIRTPIAAVMGISEIQLRSPGLPNDMGEPFAKIYDSAHTLLSIVNDILDFSKIESGKMHIINEEYDVVSLCRDVTHLHMVYLEHKNITFQKEAHENLPARLIGDALRIRQIISNLVSNAFKYTERGFVSLSLGYEAKSDDICTLLIIVKDTGFGMSAEQLDAIQTSEYSRFHEQKEGFIGGTGLGLPIVLHFVQMMNGQIEFDSEVGKGTTIVVRIPQKTCGTEVLGKETAYNLQNLEASTWAVAKSLKFEPELMPYGKVLVVDDVDANLFVAQGLLAFYELSVETCTSGKAAIEKIRSGMVYDVIFMDHLMPEMNGTEAMQAIKKLGYNHPIIVLTANALAGQAEEYIKMGFDDFISKPIQTMRLNEILIKFIRDKQPPDVIANATATAKRTGFEGSIDNFMQDTEIVQKLKAEFAKSNKNSFQNIQKALDEGDTQTAHRLAHTIKGSAGLIGEGTLSQLFGDAEEVLGRGDSVSATQLSAMEGELARVLESIGIAEVENHFADKNFDKESLCKILDQLEPLLKSQDTGCLDFISELQSIPLTAILARQIEDYDFKIALNSLVTLRKLLGG